jgi:hypothetical protein
MIIVYFGVFFITIAANMRLFDKKERPIISMLSVKREYKKLEWSKKNIECYG